MKKLLPILIIGLVIVGGSIFLLTKDKNNSKTSNVSVKPSNSNNSSNIFEGISTEGLSFKATMTTEKNGKKIVAIMEADAKTGAYKYSSDVNKASFNMIYTKDAYYTCQSADNCIKYPLSQGNSAGFDPEVYQYDNKELAKFKDTAKSLGTESCPAGTCTVWEVTSGNTKSKVYIDTKTKRVSQATGNYDNTSTQIVYDYQEVNVQIPTKFQEIKMPTLPTQ